MTRSVGSLMDAMRLLLAAAAAGIAAAALATGPEGLDGPEPRPAPAPAPTASHEELRRQVRRILLDRPCQACHLGTLKTAVPRALKVFDLVKEDWPATMKDRQLEAL